MFGNGWWRGFQKRSPFKREKSRHRVPECLLCRRLSLV